MYSTPSVAHAWEISTCGHLASCHHMPPQITPVWPRQPCVFAVVSGLHFCSHTHVARAGVERNEHD